MTLNADNTVWITLTTLDDGELELELFSEKPTFEMASNQALYQGNIDGGDSVRLFP